MAMGVAAPLLIGGTVAGAGLSVASAQSRNRAIGRSMRSANDAAGTTLGQLADQTALERLRRVRQTEQIIGRLRVASAEAGGGFGGSAAALERQAQFDSGIDRAIIDANYSNNANRVLSGLDAQELSLSSQTVNPLLAGLFGGVQGLQTGLQIYGGAQAIGDLLKTPVPVAPAPPTWTPYVPPIATTGLSIPGSALQQIPDVAPIANPLPSAYA